MNAIKINEFTEKQSELRAREITSDKEFQNKKYSFKTIKKNERVENNFILWDLSGGLLGI